MLDSFISFLGETGIAKMIAQMSNSMASGNWLQVIGTPVMIAIACVLLYLAIVKEFEPLLLLPIAFGMLLSNLPMEFTQKLMHTDFFVNEKFLIDGHLDIQRIVSEWSGII